MLFKKNMEPSCSYCTHGVKLTQDSIACLKNGIVSTYDMCSSFRYDPLKRVPSRPIQIDRDKYSQEDFSL